MAETDKKVTFELKDLSYDELVDSYLEVLDFLNFLDEIKLNVKAKVLTDEERKAMEERGENPDEASSEEKTEVEVGTDDTPKEEEAK